MEPHDTRILIGEDDAVIALDLQNQLRSLGYQVERRAGTMREIVLLAQELRPDAIVLDLNIRGDNNGLKVAAEIHRTAGIPIVFVSAYAADILENDSAALGSYRYVTKPFILAYLHTALQELLGKQHS